MITPDDHSNFSNEHFCLFRETCCLFWGFIDHLNEKLLSCKKQITKKHVFLKTNYLRSLNLIYYVKMTLTCPTRRNTEKSLLKLPKFDAAKAEVSLENVLKSRKY